MWYSLYIIYEACGSKGPILYREIYMYLHINELPCCVVVKTVLVSTKNTKFKCNTCNVFNIIQLVLVGNPNQPPGIFNLKIFLNSFSDKKKNIS